MAEVKKQLGEHIVKIEENIQKKNRTNKSISSKLDKLQMKLSRLNELYIEDMISRKEYDEKSNIIREEIMELEKSKVIETESQLHQMKETLNAFESFNEIYESLSSAEKNILYRNIISHIDIDIETMEMDIHFL